MKWASIAIVMAFSCKMKPPTLRGVPPDATCSGFDEVSRMGTCISDGKEFSCVADRVGDVEGCTNPHGNVTCVPKSVRLTVPQ